MASTNSQAYSVTPTQSRVLTDGRARSGSDDGPGDISSVARPGSKNGRSLSSSSSQFGPRSTSLAPSMTQPGSFSSDMKSTAISRSGTPRPDMPFGTISTNTLDTNHMTSEQRQAFVRDKIAKEMKIKIGTENMLEALLTKNAKQTREQRLKVESELSSSNRKIAELQSELEEEIQRANTPTTPPRSRLSTLFRGSPLRSPSQTMDVNGVANGKETFETESSTYVLTETLQALEVVGMPPDYYIARANSLVDLFKRHPTLKYDLAWSVFGLRVQMMLLSDSTEVVAAGYRLTRYAIADRRSIQIIRALHTDELVILSLVKKGKAVLEREQALKFVRAFLDVKDGVYAISRAVMRTIVAVAEHHDDRLRSICILTLAEILIKAPVLLVSAGGIGPLNEALAEGTFSASESLAASFLHILDTPRRRKYLRSGYELEAVFAPFTDPPTFSGNEDRLNACARAISAMLKTWPGLLTLSMNRYGALRSLLESLLYPSPAARDIILELLFDVLRIKPPSWSSTFLAGRRLTTYGRVANLQGAPNTKRSRADSESEINRFDLTTHFASLVLATLLEAGLVQALSTLIQEEDDQAVQRKATLLLAEVLKLANRCLPKQVSSELQTLPDLLPQASSFESENHIVSTGMIYQIDSINRTINRTGSMATTAGKILNDMLSVPDQSKSKLPASMDEAQFRLAILETQVLNTPNFLKWRWDLIHSLVEGPLTNSKRMDEAIKGSKFMKRLVGFYRPFKYRFSAIRNTKPNQRYVRTGCALMRTLIQTPEGSRYLAEHKLLRQIAECLAQVDKASGITSSSPLFSRSQMADTLSGGYFAMLGALTHDARGILMMERWHMVNMFYHIIELRDRQDLVQTLLGNMDYTVDSHLRVMLSKALTAGSKETRIFATKLLRKYAVSDSTDGSSSTAARNADWVIQLLVTQLYDPEVTVCEIAIRILEEACNQKHYLEHVVKCRPALDHLGEIGAPLLLRFLSTSVGYHYLDGLDYITQEMDDWFLGRNDSYVTLVEASLSRAYVDQPQRPSWSAEDILDLEDVGLVPPHFYRELARTSEGCKLLRQSGHFNEFASYVRDFSLDEEDPETLMKIKGCLWAVGNVGSMELGAPFLEETDVVGWIVRIAEGAEVMTMRGTAVFVLGLISRSVHGQEMLLAYGWDTAIGPRGESLGLCMPTNLSKLYSVRNPYDGHVARTNLFAFQITFQRPADEIDTKRQSRELFKAAVTDADPLNAKILSLVVDLGNTVRTKKAAADLHR